jgi:hypothetical protein
MIDAERQRYHEQYAQAQKRVPRGQVINHVIWRDGRLWTGYGPAPRPEPPAQPSGRVSRSVLQGSLL